MGNKRITPTAEEGRALQSSPVTNVLTFTKEGHHYAFVYDDKNPHLIFRAFGRLAAHPGLNFRWYDAAVLSTQVREMRRGSA